MRFSIGSIRLQQKSYVTSRVQAVAVTGWGPAHRSELESMSITVFFQIVQQFSIGLKSSDEPGQFLTKEGFVQILSFFRIPLPYYIRNLCYDISWQMERNSRPFHIHIAKKICFLAFRRQFDKDMSLASLHVIEWQPLHMRKHTYNVFIRKW